MYEMKNWIWGAGVLLLTCLIFLFNFDQAALDESLLISDSSRDILVADHLLSHRENWLISPANSSKFLPSNPTYYWLVTLMYFFAGMNLKVFFSYYMFWLSLCSIFVFLSLCFHGTKFKALVLTCIFTLIFSNGLLAKTLYQPIFSLPLVFFLLFYVAMQVKLRFTKFGLLFLTTTVLIISTIHYSNLVLLVLVPLLILIPHRKFSEKYLFYGLAALFGVSLAALALFKLEFLLESLQSMMLCGMTYFNFKEIIPLSVLVNFFLLYYGSFVKKNFQATSFIVLSLALLYLVFCIPVAIKILEMEPRSYYVLVAFLGSMFFMLHGLARLAITIRVTQFWRKITLLLILISVILKIGASPLVSPVDLKKTNAFSIAEFFAHRYFTSSIPFSVSVANFCGDTTLGSWFSGGIWLLFEKITGEKATCLSSSGENFQVCFSRPVSQEYHVCKELNSEFKLSNQAQQVFKTQEGWYVFLLP